MKEKPCYCSIENPHTAYCFKEQCPKHGIPGKRYQDGYKE